MAAISHSCLSFLFLKEPVTITLVENAPPGSIVYTVLATDIEADTLTYGKVSQFPALPDFPLNTKTGNLYVPAGINADTSEKFEFVFDVSDGRSTVVSKPLTVVISMESKQNQSENPEPEIHWITSLANKYCTII